MYKIILFVCSYFLFSCVLSNTMMQRATVAGSPRKSVVKITNKYTPNKTTLNFHYSHFAKDSIRLNSGTHTDVNTDGIYELVSKPGKDYYLENPDVNTYKFSGKNLFWDIPKQQLNFEIERTFDHFAVGAGFNSSDFNKIKFTGVNLRIGYFRNFTWFAGRFDYIQHWNKMHYNVTYLKKTFIYLPKTEDEIQVRFYNKDGTQMASNYELSISLNTVDETWPVNFYLSLNFGKQSLYNLQSEVEMFGNLSYVDFFSNFGFGLYKQINEHQRIITGIRMNYHPEGDHGIQSNDFVLQYDFQF